MRRVNSLRRVCVVPRVSGVGGMVSFRARFIEALTRRGIQICHSLSGLPYDAVLLIGGTKDLLGLWQARKRGIPVVQRLDGMNWLHRVRRQPERHSGGWRHYLRAEYGNFILALLRSRLATHVVYQSEFVRGWWERAYGRTPVPWRVIYNGVDLSSFTPWGEESPPQDVWRVLLVEGSLRGGYEFGLEVAVNLCEHLVQVVRQVEARAVELMVVGQVEEAERQRWQDYLRQSPERAHLRITFAGCVDAAKIPAIDRAAHVLFSADVHSACPNSVIEALACGLPVAAFDTGALAELVSPQAGCLVSYGSDPWQLKMPHVSKLAEAMLPLLMHQAVYRQGARAQAEAHFDLERMVDAYLEVLLG